MMQKDHVKELADANSEVIDVHFSDDDTSARKTQTEERLNMNALLKEIERGTISRLIVYSRCRLARNVIQYMKLYRTLRKFNVNVLFAAKYEFPMIYTAEGELIERILAAFNQQEAKVL